MLHIRPATAEDVDALYDLILGIARYHDQEQFVLTTKSELLASGFLDSPKFEILLAEYDSQIAAYVSFTRNYSIWLGDQYIHIDDVFVKDKFRSKGIGEALMNSLKVQAKVDGISKIKWEVQADNLKAIKFYTGLGATLRTKGLFSWKVD